MTNPQLIKSFSITAILSAAGLALWLTEILCSKGWYSLDWLQGPFYSAYIIMLFGVFAFLFPFIITKETPTKRIILSAIILYVFNVIFFAAGKFICFLFYCRWCFTTYSDLILLFVSTLLLMFTFAWIYWLVAQKLLGISKKINILYLFLLSVACIPLSLISVQLIPGFGSQTGWVDAVKMGYPILWGILLLGVSGIIIVRKN